MFEKIIKMDKPLTRLFKRKRKKKRKKKEKKKTQINKIRNENGEITTAVETIIRGGYEQVYGNTMDNLDEMNTFLEKYNLSKLNEKEIE